MRPSSDSHDDDVVFHDRVRNESTRRRNFGSRADADDILVILRATVDAACRTIDAR